MNQRMWPGRDTGHGASGLTGLHLWMTQDGYVLSAEVSGQRLVLATTSDSPDAAGAPAGTRCEPTAITGLAGRVPPGFGLLVDRSTPGRRVVSAAVIDGLRLQEPPCGDERDLRTERVPDQLGGVRNSVVASAGRTGARGISVVWTIGGGRQGLWVVVDRPVAGTLDAVYDAVARHAPFEPVRVLDQAELSEPARGLVSRAAAQDNGGTSPQEFSGRANVVILVVVLIGAVLIVLGRSQAGFTGTVLVTVGWAVQGLLILGVILAAAGRGFEIPGLPAPGVGGRARPLVFLGFLAFCGALLYQAARGLS
jgi:hypothetical protein